MRDGVRLRSDSVIRFCASLATSFRPQDFADLTTPALRATPPLRGGESGFFVQSPFATALHKKSISTGFVSDPLPLRGRPPLQGGQKTVLNQRTFLPLEKGETRAQRARGSISDFLCKAPPCKGGVD